MSSFRFGVVLLVLLLADIVVSQSPAPAPTPVKKHTPVASPAPSKKKTPPVSVPVASPAPMVPDYMAPGPSTTDAGTDCMTLLFGAADCLTFVEEGSNLTVPDKACCPELSTLVTTNPICLCQLLKKSNSFGIAIDLEKAMSLPSACNVETPDPSLCALFNGSPAGAPSDGLAPTDGVLPPTTANNDSGATAIGASASSVLGALVAVGAFTWSMF